MYILDTDVISALRVKPDTRIIEWIEARSDALFITTTTVAEIEAGIAKSLREGATRKARELNAWLDAILHLYGEHVLPFERAAARIAGSMSDRANAAGHAPGFADTTIASIAASRGFSVLTRNLKHFLPLGAQAFDPFVALPDT